MLSDIYKNRPDFKPSQVYKSFRKDLLESIEEAKLDNLQEVSDAELESLVSRIRENPSRRFTELEAKQVNEKLKATVAKTKAALERIILIKDNLHSRIKSDSNAYSLDISKNSMLRSYSNNVFGGNKNSITYDDYITLLELKKQLEIDEAFSLIED